MVACLTPALMVGPAAATAGCNGSVDVALGAPAADVGAQQDAGEVTIVFDSLSGLGNSADRTLSEAALLEMTGGTPTDATGDRFGAAVAVGHDPEDPSCSVVAVGAPGADDGSGAVWVFTIDKDGVYPETVRRITQNSSGIGGAAEPGDAFGAAVHLGGDTVRWVAVGVPGEDVGSVQDAGIVQVLPYPGLGTGSRTYTQGKGGVPGRAEAGDHFGAALGPGRSVWSLWAGAPEEDVGTTKDAGAITSLVGGRDTSTDAALLPGTVGKTTVITQDSAGVPGAVERYDHFGAVLGGIVGTGAYGREPVVGVPREDVGSVKDAGNVQVAYQDGSWGSFVQGSHGVGSAAEAGDLFGASLAAWGSLLLVGVPGEDVGPAVDAGSIHWFAAAGSVPKLSGGREGTLNQNSVAVTDEAETGDGFGASVAVAARGAVVGVPGEEVGTGGADAGAVAFLPFVMGAPELGVEGAGGSLEQASDLSLEGVVQAGAGFGATAAAYAD